MRSRSGTDLTLGERRGQTFCLVARAITSVKLSVRPSWLQCRCSQRWHDAKCTGVPSVSVIASEVMRSLPHSGQVPDGAVPAWVSEVAPVVGRTGDAARCVGIMKVSRVGGGMDLLCLGLDPEFLEKPEVPRKSDIRPVSAGICQLARVSRAGEAPA